MNTFMLAWRNIWRNRRRSSLTVLSVSFGLAAVMTAQSLMKTVQAQLIEKSAGVRSGHLEVQRRLETNRKVPERSIARPELLESLLRKDHRVEAVSARLLHTGLVYSAAGSRGVLICGVEPDNEALVSTLHTYLTQGRYFAGGARDAVLGDKLARELDLRLGEKLVVMSQSQAGEMNSELFRVAGIYHTGSETFDGQAIYVPIAMAQTIRGEKDRISYLAIRLKDSSQVDQVQADYERRAESVGDVLLTYSQVGLEIVGIQKFEDAALGIVMVIIFVIVGFGVLNTISMSLFERMREFGVLRAIGAKPGEIARMVILESFLMGIIGTGLGLTMGLGLIKYYGIRGLALPVGEAVSYWLPFDALVYLRPYWPMHWRSLAGIMVVSVLAALGPALRAARIRIAEALRHI